MGVCGVAGVVIVKNYVVRCCAFLRGGVARCMAITQGVTRARVSEGVAPGMSIRGRCPRLRDFALSGRSVIKEVIILL